MKINILPGTRFHSIQLIEQLAALDFDLRVYSSSPKKNFRTQSLFSYRFVPMLGVIIDRALKIHSGRFELIQNKIYDGLCQLAMRECDVLHGWAGMSLESGMRAQKKGALYLLERSCPHVLFQEQIIAEECEKLEIPYEPKPDWWIERSMQEYSEADFIVTPSTYTQQTLIDKGLPEAKVKRIPLDRVVDLNFKTGATLKRELVVGCIIGNPVRKGLIYLLEAWERLNLKNAKLLIKMNRADLNLYPILVDRVNRQKNVEVKPYYPSITDFYRECDIFALPSVDEGYGLVITEALAHGLPCIATHHVGAAENYVNDPFVKVVPPRNTQALAEVLNSFYENPEQIIGLRESIRKKFEDPAFRVSQYEKTLKDLYQSQVPTQLKQNHKRLNLSISH